MIELDLKSERRGAGQGKARPRMPCASLKHRQPTPSARATPSRARWHEASVASCRVISGKGLSQIFLTFTGTYCSKHFLLLCSIRTPRQQRSLWASFLLGCTWLVPLAIGAVPSPAPNASSNSQLHRQYHRHHRQRHPPPRPQPACTSS